MNMQSEQAATKTVENIELSNRPTPNVKHKRVAPTEVEGYFDGVDDGIVYGWTFDKQNPEETLSVEILSDGVVVARAQANRFRPDLLAAKIGDGKHLFQVSLPRRLFDGEEHEISVREEITGRILRNSPKIVFLQKKAPAIRIDRSAAVVRYQEGLAAYNKKEWEIAEAALKEASRFDPNDGEIFWTLAKTLEKIGRIWEAAEAAKKAIDLDPRHASWHTGYANFLERLDRLNDAETAYRNAISLKPNVGDTHYRLGHVLEKQGRHEDADYAYTFAIELDPADVGRKFGPGVYHAARGLWASAATAYEKWIQYEGAVAESHYRLGLAYDRCYRWNDAAASYRKALALDSTNASWHFRLGVVLERAGAWQEAALSYRNALARKETHDAAWYYRLGYSLSQAGQHIEACEAYRWMTVRGRPYGVDAKMYDADSAFVTNTTYNEYYECLGIVPEVILYESFHGSSMSCNPFALFNYLLNHNEFKTWTHVWVINGPEKVPEEYKKYPNVIFIQRGCDAYLRYLAVASHLINNVSFPDYFMRKPDQVYLNTWHGTPLKNLGKDVKAPFLDHKNITRNFLHSSHIISPNQHTTEIISQRYDIADIYNGKFAETGYPRVDLTIAIADEEKERIRSQLGISSGKKIVLYAPTWRGTTGKAAFDADKLSADMAKLADLDATILFRGHHMTEKMLATTIANLRVVPQSIDTNALLSIVDVLITDYSSIYFDFLSTKRPIIHYVFDYTSYCDERGMYFSLDEMPGVVCTNIVDVKLTLKKMIKHPHVLSKNYSTAIEKFSIHDDGDACKRVIDFVFFSKTTHNIEIGKNRKAILFFEGPFVRNGITSSFINLMASIDRSQYLPVIAVDPGNISKYPERITQFNLVRDNASILGRSGSMCLSPEEKWVIEKYNKHYVHVSGELHDIYARAYKKEFYRMYGSAKFHAHVNFEGYSRFWTSLLAYGPENNNTVFLHSDMYSEWKLKYPNLLAILSLYTHYSKVISVSEPTHRVNTLNLTKCFAIPSEKFDYCVNTIDSKRVAHMSAEVQGATVPARDPQKIVFITMGRMSPEKDHRKLIDAFEMVHTVNPATELWILGDGPLRSAITMQIDDYGLQDSVLLLGQQSNPFPFLKEADCFVLSSNHEGQPMVLLESLILGKPIISTDIPGARSVVGNGFGYLAQNNVDSLAEGMRAFINGELNFEKFDFEHYQQTAMKMFYEKAIDHHA